MAYKALYRTYRPQAFSEVVGQKNIITTLTNALKDNKIAQAYLFCGPRGTGKTTMARLFAKALNCSQGIGQECGTCENCKEIIAGTHPDVVEIDAASNSGVDNVRSLIEQVGFAPILGRYKVYIIDEVQSMSSSAFNALLKTLEEPPANVVFILATTEPNKVLPTILSRVQRFDFSKVSDEDIISKMKEIMGKEKIGYEEEALKLIARLSDGGVRDALSMLDQAISFGGDKITEEDIYTLFGLLQISDKISMIKMIHLNDVKGVLSMAKDKYEHGADIIRLHDDLINIYKDLLVYGTTRDPSLLNFLKPEEALSILVTPGEIRRNLDILIAERRSYRNVLNTFDEFELTLIKLSMADASAPDLNSAQVALSPIPAKSSTKENDASSNKASKKIDDFTSKISLSSQTDNTSELPASSFNKDQEPETIRTDAMESDLDQSANGKVVKVDEKTIINIMVQGNKEMKNSLIQKWNDKLNAFPKSDENAYLASALTKCMPVVACSEVVVIKTFFKGVVRTVNLLENQKKIEGLMKTLFGLDVKVIALFNSDFIDYVHTFMNLDQAHGLPKPEKIVIEAEISKDELTEKTNAESFVDLLKK